MEEKIGQLNKLKLDKEIASQLVAAHGKWIKFLVISQTTLALLNSALLLTGTLLYGKETVKILKRRMENQE